MKLFELTDNYNQILDMIDEGAEGLQDTLESLEGAIEDKVDGIGRVLKALEYNTKAIKEEEQRLSQRRKTLENEANNLKVYLASQLDKIGKKKVKGTLYSANIQNNPPSVNVLDTEKIPEEYWVIPEVQPQLNKKALLQALKDGKEVEGATMTQGSSLRIR